MSLNLFDCIFCCCNCCRYCLERSLGYVSVWFIVLLVYSVWNYAWINPLIRTLSISLLRWNRVLISCFSFFLSFFLSLVPSIAQVLERVERGATDQDSGAVRRPPATAQQHGQLRLERQSPEVGAGGSDAPQGLHHLRLHLLVRDDVPVSRSNPYLIDCFFFNRRLIRRCVAINTSYYVIILITHWTLDWNLAQRLCFMLGNVCDVELQLSWWDRIGWVKCWISAD